MNLVRIAFSNEALHRTATAAVVVGSVLAFVNSGARRAQGDVDGWLALRVVLTLAMPWLNSSYGYTAGGRQADLAGSNERRSPRRSPRVRWSRCLTIHGADVPRR